MIAIVGTELSTTNDPDVAATRGFPAKSDQAELPTVIVGEPFPVQLESVTTAVVDEVTLTDLLQVAPPPLNVMAESMVPPVKDDGFASANVSV